MKCNVFFRSRSREDGVCSHDLKEDVSSPFYVEHNNKIERTLLDP